MFITHILRTYYVLDNEDTVVNSEDSAIRDTSFRVLRSLAERKSKVWDEDGRRVRKSENIS